MFSNFSFQNFCSRGQTLIGIIIVLILVGLICGGLYYYLSKQISEVSQISEKTAGGKAVEPDEKVTPPAERELSNEETSTPAPEGKTTPISEPEKPIIQKCTDGTFYGQCSNNKSKYCDNGILVDKISLCGCPTNFKLQNGKCTPLVNTNETIVFGEKNPGEILIPPTAGYEWWSINVEKFKEQFYQNYGDFYDFILLFPTKSLQAHYSVTVNYDVKGLGVGYKPDSNLKQLKSITELDFYTVWSAFSESTIRQELLKTIVHEMGHHWCCYIEGLGINLPLHWTYNIDLFNGNPAYLDIMGYYQWIRKDSQEICVDNIPSITKRFSDLTLYLMGLLPKEQVQPIYVHDFEKKPNDSNFNTWGPFCGQEHQFTATRMITINDIIGANGERVPSYNESQKNFRVVFIVLAEKDENVPQGFFDYVNLYKQALPTAWREATIGKSTISF